MAYSNTLRPISGILTFVACSIVIFMPASAFAGWEEVDDLTESSPADEMLNNSQCQYRVRLKDDNHASSGTFKDHFFLVTKVLQFREDSVDGTVISQTFKAPISGSDTSALMFNGALSRSNWDSLQELYNSPKNPWDLKIQVRRNSQYRSVGLAYTFYNADWGSNANTSLRLNGEKLSLEALCSKGEPQEISGLSAIISSEYPYSDNYGPEKMFDDNHYSFWVGEPRQDGYSIAVDTNKVHDLSKLKIDWYTPYYAATDFDVEVSADGRVYELVASGLNRVTEVDLSGYKGRFIQITMHSLANPTYPIVSEVDVWKE
jgi:hypothetical protein